MTKDNKVLKALERIRQRIKVEVGVSFKPSEHLGGRLIKFYQIDTIDTILREEIIRAVREGE